MKDAIQRITGGFQRGQWKNKWQLMTVSMVFKRRLNTWCERMNACLREVLHLIFCVFSKEGKVILRINVLQAINWRSK